MQFVDGIDSESISFRYCNSLNQFRYDHKDKIDFQKEINQSGPFKENKFVSLMVEKFRIEFKDQLIEPNFDFLSLFINPSQDWATFVKTYQKQKTSQEIIQVQDPV